MPSSAGILIKRRRVRELVAFEMKIEYGTRHLRFIQLKFVMDVRIWPKTSLVQLLGTPNHLAGLRGQEGMNTARGNSRGMASKQDGL